MPRAARSWLGLLVAMASLLATPARAVQPDEILADPKLEARARDLSRELRCMVCQNQSIDDSDAPLARDLRLLVRERLTAGDSNEQVLDFLTDRYGQFVLLGGLGLVLLRRRSRTSPVSATEQPLTEAEQARLAALLEKSKSSTPGSA